MAVTVCAGAVIATFVEVLAVDMCVDALIIVSDVAVGSLMDALAALILGVLTGIGVDVLVGVNVNVPERAITEFAMPGPLEEFRC